MPDGKPILLLEDNTGDKLIEYSFYTFIRTSCNQESNTDGKETNSLSLVCTDKELNFKLYSMPDSYDRDQ